MKLPSLRSAPAQASLVVEPGALDASNQTLLRAWMGLSAEAMQTLVSAGQSLPVSGPGDATTITAQSDRLAAVGMPVTAEQHTRPFARVTRLTFRVGVLCALVAGILFGLLDGLLSLSGTLSDPVLLSMLIPYLISIVVAMGSLPAALIFFTLGAVRKQGRVNELASTAEKISQLRTPTLTGEPGRLQAHCQDLSRRVVEAGLPVTLREDLLAGLMACQDALPQLARSLTSVEAAMEGADSTELAQAHARLTATLQAAATRVSMVEVGLAELTANSLEGRGANNESALSTVKKTAAALTGLAREMR